MPIFDFTCPKCGFKDKDRLVSAREIPVCPKCFTDMKKDLTAHAGYSIMGNNGASQRPKQAGSFKKKQKD